MAEGGNGRLEKLEAIVDQQAKNVGALQQSISAVSEKMDAGFQRINAELATIGKTSWPLVATIIGLIVSATLGSVGLMLTIGSMALTPVQRQIDNVRETMAEHKALPGHFEAMRLHAAYVEKFETIRAELNALEAKVAPLDDRIRVVERDRFTGTEARDLLQRVTRLESGVPYD